MKPVHLHPSAFNEFDQALAYYRAIDSELSDSLFSIFEEATIAIGGNPKIAAQYETSQYRRYVLKRFPYVMFYRETPEAILIVAIAHGRQKPDYWADRD